MLYETMFSTSYNVLTYRVVIEFLYNHGGSKIITKQY